MPLKATVDTLDSVAEPLRSLYEPKDGKFVLSVEGMVSSDRLNEFRTNNVELRRERDALVARFDGIDPDEHRALSETARKAREDALKAAGKVDELVAERVGTMKADHDRLVLTVSGERDALKGQLESLVIDGSLRDAAMKAGVAPTAVDDVLLRGRAAFKLVDGKAVAMNGDKPAYGKDSEPLGVVEWIGGLREVAPHLFPASSGGGAPHSNTATGNKVSITRHEFDALPPAGQVEAAKNKTIVD